MSHKATNWAFDQKGLKPAAKLVLLCLADRHNTDNGCFPAQDTLAEDACMSRRSVNDQLNILEEQGFIRRRKRIDPATGRQKSTEYVLNFDHKTRVQESHMEEESVCKSEHEPCANHDMNRVQNLHTNPVIEPVKEPVMAPMALTASPSEDLDKILYQRGKSVLGQKAAGQITKLKGLMGTGKALELIDISSRKENPNEYIAAIIRNEAAGGRSKTESIMQGAAARADTILADRAATGIRY